MDPAKRASGAAATRSRLIALPGCWLASHASCAACIPSHMAAVAPSERSNRAALGFDSRHRCAGRIFLCWTVGIGEARVLLDDDQASLNDGSIVLKSSPRPR